ncbi:hypothetical protein DRQ25_18560 [Candidatus Fermentibacteria bacterium]|nr:MAG: hypothetical protein DRQ25_18560 [Candidatus Fermentibacteria bacterium]
MKTTLNKAIKVNDKFVCSWGYDQTQYSVYEVVSTKGKFATVRGLNSWSSLDGYDLAVGSKVKAYQFKEWHKLNEETQADYTSRGFDFNSYRHHKGKEAEENAPVRTIVKAGRIDGDRFSYVWTLDTGEVVRSDERYDGDLVVKVVDGLKRCLVNTKYDRPYIRINQTIQAGLDPNYDDNKQAYADQNEYTAYNGH